MPDESDPRERPAGPRPFWSGSLTFGLVNVPVRLFSAVRSGSPSLRMVDEDGTPLTRRYVCPREDRPVPADELVRGYDVSGTDGDDEWVVVTDEELESLQPGKSREIDLRHFVPVDDLDPVFFQRAYILTPDEGSAKAYRLLARVMEETGRAGVATFVMRTREYLVAILARDGVLRAETMRFHDEVRSPEDVGLSAPEGGSGERAGALVDAMEELAMDELDPDELTDREAEALEALVEAKRKRGEDVVEVGEEVREGPPEGGRVIDLLEVLRRSLGEPGEADAGRRPAARADRAGGSGDDDSGALHERTKDELYRRARELDIPGRSSMTKAELVEAIRARSLHSAPASTG